MALKNFHLDKFCTEVRFSGNVDAKRGLHTIQKLLSLVRSVKLEILENAATLNDTQRSYYFESIQERMFQLGDIVNPNKSEVKSLLNQFNTTHKEIESNNIANKSFKDLLDLYIDPYMFDNKTESARQIQRAFVGQYSSLCIQRIIKFCETSLPHSQYKNEPEESNGTQQSHPEELLNEEAFDWFKNTLYNRNVLSKEGIKKRGFAAVAHAIFQNSDCKNYILKSNLRLSEFITFLNREYSAEVKSQKSLSDGTKHELYISKQIANFIARYLQDE